MGEQIDQVDALMTQARDYLVDVAVLAIVKAESVKREAVRGVDLKTFVTNLQDTLAKRQSELVAAIAIAIQRSEE